LGEEVVKIRSVNVWVVVYLRSFGARMDEDEVLHEYLQGYLEKLPFRPNSSLQEEFYPRNINYMPAVKFYLRLDFERKF
jgi:hypothetical protein